MLAKNTIHETRFDAATFENQLAGLQNLLASKTDLEEVADVQPILYSAEQLLMGLGVLFRMEMVTHVAVEFALQSRFRTDIMVGCEWGLGLIELEDARRKSMFDLDSKKSVKPWGDSISKGFSQVVDWVWKLETMDDGEFARHFPFVRARQDCVFSAAVITGRKTFVPAEEFERVNWRSNRIRVGDSQTKIAVATYDEASEALKYYLQKRREFTI